MRPAGSVFFAVRVGSHVRTPDSFGLTWGALKRRPFTFRLAWVHPGSLAFTWVHSGAPRIGRVHSGSRMLTLGV